MTLSREALSTDTAVKTLSQSHPSFVSLMEQSRWQDPVVFRRDENVDSQRNDCWPASTPDSCELKSSTLFESTDEVSCNHTDDTLKPGWNMFKVIMSDLCYTLCACAHALTNYINRPKMLTPLAIS